QEIGFVSNFLGAVHKCGSWLACDSGLTIGAYPELKSLLGGRKSGLFISNAPFKFTKATFCPVTVRHELIKSWANRHQRQ
ncbi:hypothetical protein, partial [Pseudomonas brenneri]|uniref:hypothetical protein n=1 Tax=Pseudomonas brenneri TaxID=129817 RepID=UPI0028D833D4